MLLLDGEYLELAPLERPLLTLIPPAMFGPPEKYCDGYVVASIASSVFTGSYATPLSAINTIIAACAHQHPQRTLALLRDYE